MGKEIVKYNNVMNKLHFKDFTAMDYNFLMGLCSRLRDYGTEEMIFTFSEVKKLANYSTKNTQSRFINDLTRMNDKLMKVRFIFEIGEEIHMFVLFPTFVINKQSKTLKVRVNEEYKFILNELVGNFTRFELDEFDNLKSKYSKSLYRLLKQFKSSGKYYVKFDELRILLDAPKSMSNKIIKRDILVPAVNELKDYFKNLIMIIEVDDSKRGSPFKNCVFLFNSVAKQKEENPTTVIAEPEELQEPVQQTINIEELMQNDLQKMNFGKR